MCSDQKLSIGFSSVMSTGVRGYRILGGSRIPGLALSPFATVRRNVHLVESKSGESPSELPIFDWPPSNGQCLTPPPPFSRGGGQTHHHTGSQVRINLPAPTPPPTFRKGLGQQRGVITARGPLARLEAPAELGAEPLGWGGGGSRGLASVSFG